MADKKTTKDDAAKVKLPVSAGTFPALRRFLRGYLHEDWPEDHDTPAEAAEQFCEDASAEERQDVAREWEELRQGRKIFRYPPFRRSWTNSWGQHGSLRPRTKSKRFRPYFGLLTGKCRALPVLARRSCGCSGL